VNPEVDELLSALRRHGLRITPARRAVCQVLAGAPDQHLTAVELHKKVEARMGRPVDPSTIYRTIDTLEEAGLLHHVHLGHGAGVIHLSTEDSHHHITCDVCGRTVDLPAKQADRILRALLTRNGFEAGSLHFALVATCTDHTKKGDAR
jgi:Fur family ferric uptake transcriptional regulator